MVNQSATFEVEIRCRFTSQEEAYKVLPFLHSCLENGTQVSWSTRFYGLSLFRSGQLLRAGEANRKGEVRHFFGWKGPDELPIQDLQEQAASASTVRARR